MIRNQLLTLFDKPLNEMNRTELRREYKVQRFLLRQINSWRRLYEFKDETANKPSTVREDRIEFLTNLEKHLEAECAAIEWYMKRRPEDNTIPYSEVSPYIREKRRIAQKERMCVTSEDINRRKAWLRMVAKDGINLTWDKEKFLLVARDRGYQTEEAIIYAVGKDLCLERDITLRLLGSGKFTWAQVLCVGALFEMTPKEFCDIFMSGYFTEQFGNYVASYDIIDRSALLHSKKRGKA